MIIILYLISHEHGVLTCALLRTAFTVAPPSFAHRAAAHVLGDLGGQGKLATPDVGHYPVALGQLGCTQGGGDGTFLPPWGPKDGCWNVLAVDQPTDTLIPLQDKTGLAETFEAPQSVQTISILTDALHGALVDIFKAGQRGSKNTEMWFRYTVGSYL